MACASEPVHKARSSTFSEVVGLSDGAAVTVRPIELSDAGPLRRMFDLLSEESTYHRFFSPAPAPRLTVLRHLAGVNHGTHEALVALDGHDLVGVANYDGEPGGSEAEVAVTVVDAWQGRGLGTILLRRLARLALDRGVVGFRASVLGENRGALRFLRRLNSESDVRFDQGEYVVYSPLRRRHSPSSAG